MTIEEAFKLGWQAGMYDGGEHDCRMFSPTAERAWERYCDRQKFLALPKVERVKTYRCTGCLGPVHLIGSRIECALGCQWGNQFQERL